MKNLENKTLEELLEMQKQWESECNSLEDELRMMEQECNCIYDEIDKRKQV